MLLRLGICLGFRFAIHEGAGTEANSCQSTDGELSCGIVKDFDIGYVLPRVLEAANCSVQSGVMLPSGAWSDASERGLECLFKNLGIGVTSGFDDIAGLDEETRSMQTYGEFSPSMFIKLIAGLGVLDVPVSRDDAFADLGSGTGKLPLTAFLVGMRSSTGIELAQHRHDMAAKAVQTLRRFIDGAVGVEVHGFQHIEMSLQHSIHFDEPGDRSSVNLHAGSLLDLPLSDLSIVYAASLCFPDELMDLLTNRLRAELRPGTLFWTLKELPVGRHTGLARVRTIPGAASWDPNAQIMVYMRVPEIILPQMPLPAAEGGDSEERAREKELLAAWIISMLNTARAEFGRLRSIAGSTSTLNSTEFLHVASHIGVTKEVAGRRLFNAFGTKAAQADGSNRCGCKNANASAYFSDVNTLEMLAHGAFPEEARGPCFSSTRSCTLADVIAESIYLDLRSRASCASPSAPRSCGLRKSALSGDRDLAQGSWCMRMSDGRTLLQVAVMGRSAEISSFMLKKWGANTLLCADYDGQTVVHTAARQSTPDMLKWLEPHVKNMTSGDPLSLRDFAGRLPWDIASRFDTLESFESIFGAVPAVVEAQ